MAVKIYNAARLARAANRAERRSARFSGQVWASWVNHDAQTWNLNLAWAEEADAQVEVQVLHLVEQMEASASGVFNL